MCCATPRWAGQARGQRPGTSTDRGKTATAETRSWSRLYDFVCPPVSAELTYRQYDATQRGRDGCELIVGRSLRALDLGKTRAFVYVLTKPGGKRESFAVLVRPPRACFLQLGPGERDKSGNVSIGFLRRLAIQFENAPDRPPGGRQPAWLMTRPRVPMGRRLEDLPADEFITANVSAGRWRSGGRLCRAALAFSAFRRAIKPGTVIRYRGHS